MISDFRRLRGTSVKTLRQQRPVLGDSPIFPSLAQLFVREEHSLLNPTEASLFFLGVPAASRVGGTEFLLHTELLSDFLRRTTCNRDQNHPKIEIFRARGPRSTLEWLFLGTGGCRLQVQPQIALSSEAGARWRQLHEKKIHFSFRARFTRCMRRGKAASLPTLLPFRLGWRSYSRDAS